MFYKLESLRGVAACLVVLHHSAFSYWDKDTAFVVNSYLFVDFFFVLSGFVMALAYSSRINTNLGFKEYTILRLGRVYPLHFFMLFLWLPYILGKQFMFDSGFGGTDQFDTNNLGSFLSNLFLVNAMGLQDHHSWNYPAWSISVEFFAYIAFYWLTVSIDKKKTLLVPLLISILSYSVIILLGSNDLNITHDWAFFRCLGAFYIGVFVCRLSHLQSLPKMTKTQLSALEALCIVSIAILVSFADLHLYFFIPIIVLFAVSVYIFCQEQSGYVGDLLLVASFRKIGLWSYSIYMVHALVVAVVVNVFEYILHWEIESALGMTSVFINIFILALVIFVSRYSYALVETVFRDKSRILAKKYRKSIEQPSTTAPS